MTHGRMRSLCTARHVFSGVIILLALIVFLTACFTWARGVPSNTVLTNEPKLHGPITDNEARRQAIKDAFQFAWDGYYTTAFPHDELKPRSNTAGRSRNDWGATAVDALGTAILMEKQDIVKVILRHIEKIDFHSTDTPISLFESTIRYVGGLLSAYELLNGPFKSWSLDTEILLTQATTLGGVLAAAFDNSDALPSGDLSPRRLEPSGKNSLAGAGTLILEWSKLSELTGNATFRSLARRAEDALLKSQAFTKALLPGLKGKDVDIRTGASRPSQISWGGSSDSYYEYLLKMWVYDSSTSSAYKDSWLQAANSTIEHLASVPQGCSDLTFLGQYDDKSGLLVPISGHMECFAGGNFLLGGQVLQDPRLTSFGLRLVEGCHHVYEATATRIGPETFQWYPSECSNSQLTPLKWRCEEPPASAQNFYDKSKFWIRDPSYNLRPEVIESYYYAYRVTKDQKYRDWAWNAWQAIDGTARLSRGYNFLGNVDVPGGRVNIGDNQESYFFSETLKYLYLIFSEDAEWQVAGPGEDNEWVYSTEGHPLKVLSR